MSGIKDLELRPGSRLLDSDPLSEQVYLVLRDAICDGVFPDHMHLVQGDLATQLQVSRTPVRDALLRLSQEKLVRGVGARGYIVEALSERDVLDIYEIRLSLEIQGAQLALPHFSVAAMRRLEEINDNINDPRSPRIDQYDLNRDFHMAVIEPCPNRLLVKIIGDTWEQPMSRRVFRRQLAAHDGQHSFADDHQPIISALRDRDAEALQVELVHHLVTARNEVSRFLSAGDGKERDVEIT
jgi:DNA-binding GntR family transcriptional regulator